MICPNCNKQNPDNEKFCTGCGTQLNATVLQPAVTKKKSKAPLIIGIIVAILIVVVIVFIAVSGKIGIGTNNSSSLSPNVNEAIDNENNNNDTVQISHGAQDADEVFDAIINAYRNGDAGLIEKYMLYNHPDFSNESELKNTYSELQGVIDNAVNNLDTKDFRDEERYVYSRMLAGEYPKYNDNKEMYEYSFEMSKTQFNDTYGKELEDNGFMDISFFDSNSSNVGFNEYLLIKIDGRWYIQDILYVF